MRLMSWTKSAFASSRGLRFMALSRLISTLWLSTISFFPLIVPTRTILAHRAILCSLRSYCVLRCRPSVCNHFRFRESRQFPFFSRFYSPFSQIHQPTSRIYGARMFGVFPSGFCARLLSTRWFIPIIHSVARPSGSPSLMIALRLKTRASCCRA